jgi:hypothetical protein
MALPNVRISAGSRDDVRLPLPTDSLTRRDVLTARDVAEVLRIRSQPCTTSHAAAFCRRIASVAHGDSCGRRSRHGCLPASGVSLAALGDTIADPEADSIVERPR